MKKRIAFVRLRYLPPTETFIYEELKNIKRYKPIVFTQKKMNIKRFPYRHIVKLPKNTKNMKRVLKKNRVRLIHARYGLAGVELMKVKKKLGVPMLTSFHGFDLPAKINLRDSYQRKLPTLFRIGDRFTVPSRQMKRLLIRRGCPARKISVQYSGIDLRKFSYKKRPKKTKGIRLLAVARLNEKKGLTYLIKAFKSVHKTYPHSNLVIVGDGPERSKLRSLIKKLNLKKHVKLKGDLPHTKIAKELKRADIFCLPSVTTKEGNQEGIPNAIKEAMASGLPIVATKHGGIPELISQNKEGLLVKERDIQALTSRILKLIENPKMRIAMGKRGRTKIKRFFNSKRQVKKLENIYSKLIRRK